MQGSCLCGEVRWEAGQPFTLVSHCHCSRCRKAHGSAYATYAATPSQSFQRSGAVAGFASSPGLSRCVCPRCGAVVPSDPADELTFVPLGGLDGDPRARPGAHIFVASKAAWFELTDDLPRFDAFPPGVDAAPLPTPRPLDPPGPPRGSCLCGGVGFVITEPVRIARYCHCGRCRKARAAAHAANLLVSEAALTFTRGRERLVSYKVPEALRFTQTFCRDCGGKLPRVDPERKLAVVPMGSLDDDPGIRPQEHIFTSEKAAWDEISDGLPQHAAYPPDA